MSGIVGMKDNQDHLPYRRLFVNLQYRMLWNIISYALSFPRKIRTTERWDLDLPKNNEPHLTENCNPASKLKYRKKTIICIGNRNTIYKHDIYKLRSVKKSSMKKKKKLHDKILKNINFFVITYHVPCIL